MGCHLFLDFNCCVFSGSLKPLEQESRWFSGWVGGPRILEGVSLLGGQKLNRKTVKKYNLYIFGSKGAFNSKLSEKAKFNKKRGTVGSLVTFY